MLRRTTWLWKRPIEVLRRTENVPHFDVCVIGGGPAGIAAALRAVDYQKKACIVEADRLGGAEVWNGSLPSKTLWEISTVVARMASPAFAERFMDPTAAAKLMDAVDEDRIRATLQHVCMTKEQQYRDILRASGVELIRGKAMFSSEEEVDVHCFGTGEYRVVSADYFVIATGSTPRPHPLYPADGKRVVTSDHIFNVPIPESLVVVGAGSLGCEMANMYASLGKTKVYLIDKAARILPDEDEDVALHAQNQLLRRGVTIHHDCHLFDLEACEEHDDGATCQYSVQHRKTGAVETYRVERALLTVGRMSNYQGLGLENTKMRVQNGKVEVDEYNRCLPYEHIYCVGDASNDRPVVSVAQSAARAAVDDIYAETGKRQRKAMEKPNISSVFFLESEVGCVGLNETQCKAQQIGYIAATYGYQHLSRAAIMGVTEGFVKLIVTNDAEKRVLGVRAMGCHSGSVIEVAALAVRNGVSAYELAKLTAAYASVVEGLVECVRMVVGHATLKPNIVPGLLLTEWKPANYARGRARQLSVAAREAEAVLLDELRLRHDEERTQAKWNMIKEVIAAKEAEEASHK